MPPLYSVNPFMSTGRLEEASRPRVLSVEDHGMFAQTLLRLLNGRGGCEARTIGSAEDALTDAKEHETDLVLIDVSLPGHDGIWLAKQLHRANPSLPLVMLSGHSEVIYVELSLTAGARGYVLKDDMDGILIGIRTVLDGGTYISPGVSEDDSVFLHLQDSHKP